MSETCNSTAKKVVSIALSYVGAKQGSAKHKELIKAFNSVKPHGYTARSSDAWCAIAWSAWQILAGNNQRQVPMSCNCSQIIADAKNLGIWIENDGYKPCKGDAILYDWEDSGKGDNKGIPNHIGLVWDADNKYIYVVEGNKGTTSTCGKRAVARNGRFIRGFVAPRYKVETVSKVKVDGKWSYMTTLLSQKVMKTHQDGIVDGQRTACKKYLPNVSTTSWKFSKGGKGSKLVRAIQKVAGAKIDGIMGKKSVIALQTYLKELGYYKGKVDGVMGSSTVKAWQKYINTHPTPKAINQTNRKKIAKKAKQLAYSGQPSEAKYPSGHPKAEYKTALNRVYPDRDKWDRASKAGAGCDVFVGTVIRACGIDSKFPRKLKDQQEHLAKSSKFKCVISNTKSSVSKADLQDGDIVTYLYNNGTGHIMIYAGGKARHAAHAKWYGRTTSIVSRLRISKRKFIKVYRAK